MKRILITIFTIVTCLCAFGLTACEEEHTCVYGSVWNMDATAHWKQCEVCYEEGTKTPHDWDSGVVITPATATSTGVKEFTCNTCGKSKIEGIPMLSHTHDFSSNWGSNADTHWKNCTICHEVGENGLHDWDSGVVIMPATVTATGVKEFTCNVCGKIKKTEIEMLPHTHDFSSGWLGNANEHWKSCEICHEESDKQNHDWDDGVVITQPTTSATGVKEYTCNTCGKLKKEEIPIIPHVCEFESEWSNNDTDHWYACNKCDKVKDKAEHTWDKVVVTLPATTTQDGVKQFTCSVCSSIKTEIIPKLPATNQPIYQLTNDNGSYVVTGFDGAIAEVTIPNLYNGLRVIAIGDKAFFENNSIKKITLPNSIKSIGNSAFENCANLTSINMPESLVNIGNSAFSGCTSLTSIGFEKEIAGTVNNFLQIGNYAFKGCINVLDLELATNTKTLGVGAFENCYSLKTVTFNEGLESIGAFAFDNCVAITEIVMTDKIKTLGDGAFRNCEKLKTVTLSSSLNIIGNASFHNCKALKEIDILPSITSIGVSAFSYCDSLSTIKIQGDLIAIGDQSFYRCENVEEIYFNSSTKLDLKNENYIFYNVGVNKQGVKLTLGPKAYIPHGLLEPIHNQNTPKIKSIIIEDGATSIDYLTTYNHMPYLTTVSIPDTVTSISPLTFSDCENLQYKTENNLKYLGNENNPYHYLVGVTNNTITSVNVNAKCKIISTLAFSECDSVTSVTAPYNYVDFNNLFNDTAKQKIKRVVINGGDTLYGSLSDFTAIENLTIPFVGSKSDGTGYTHFGYMFGANSYNYNNDYAPQTLKTVVITGGESIGSYAFYNCDSLTSVTIPNSVTSIGNSAFAECDSLTSVTIPNSVTSIGNSAFYNCDSLTSITIPNSVTSIGNSAFSGCSSLISITLPFVGAKAGVTSSNTYQYPFGYIFGTSSYTGGVSTTQYYYGSSTSSTTYSTFYIPSSLKSVTITGGNILYGAFYNCGSLTSVTIGDSVTSIGNSAFYNCDSLTSVTMPNSVTSIGNSAFYDCDSLTSITIPNSVTSIGESAFRNCDSLTSVTIPNSVTSIGNSAFSGCDSLTSITIPNSVTSIGNSAFYDCDSLTSITIPNSVTSIGSGAFSACSSLISITLPFVGAKAGVTSSNTYQYPFGYIFGTSSYNGSTAVTQRYYGSSTSSTTSTTYYIPSTLKSVTITGGNILYGAFYNCGSLTSVTIGDSVTSIGSSAFYNCDSLTSITIPNSVTSIGSSAFEDCDSLTSVTIGNSVTSIGYYAFYSCDSLKNIYFKDNTSWYRTTNSSYWQGKYNGTYINVDSSSANATYFKSSYYNYYWYKI